MVTELAIKRIPKRRIVFPGEADTPDRCRWNQRRKNVDAGQGKTLESPGAKLRKHVGIAAELVVGKYLQFEPAIGRLCEFLCSLFGVDVERVRLRHVGAQLEREFGCLRISHRNGRADRGESRERSETATRECGHFFLRIN